jgi:hypothetical protein
MSYILIYMKGCPKELSVRALTGMDKCVDGYSVASFHVLSINTLYPDYDYYHRTGFMSLIFVLFI